MLLAAAHNTDEPIRAKLTDFGVARFLNGTRMTMVGMTVGTADYLSPEQAHGQDVTPASDIYSLGLVLIECLAGARVYPGYGVEAALARLHRDPDIPRGLHPARAALLVAMTARDPRQRPTAAQVEATLRNLPKGELPTAFDAADVTTEHLGPLPGASWIDEAAAGTTSRTRRPRRRALLLALSGGIAAALAVALLVPLLGSSHSSATDPRTAPSSSSPPETDRPLPARTAGTKAVAAPSPASPRPAPSRSAGGPVSPKAHSCGGHSGVADGAVRPDLGEAQVAPTCSPVEDAPR